MIRDIVSRNSGFDPRQVPGMSLWLDGSDLSTFTLDVYNNISQWRDKSGNNRHVAQAVEANRPTLSTATLNGLNAVKFQVKTLSHSLTYSLGSLFIVWEHPTTYSGSYNGIAGYRNGGGSDLEMSLLLPLTPGGPPPTRVWELYSALDTSTIIRFNRVQRPSSENEAASASPARVSPHRWNIMSSTFAVKTGIKVLQLGTEAYLPTGRYMQNGHIAEIIGYNSPLSSTSVVNIETYLYSKWNLW